MDAFVTRNPVFLFIENSRGFYVRNILFIMLTHVY